MQENLSEILDNILSLLLLEGSYEVNESKEGFEVMIDTPQAGRLIGFRGESLDSLQLLINQLLSRKQDEFKRVILDVAGWRKQKEEELKEKASSVASQVLELGQELELEPMSSWQRRIVHMVIGDTPGVESESIGEGRDRHLVIRPSGAKAETAPSSEPEN